MSSSTPPYLAKSEICQFEWSNRPSTRDKIRPLQQMSALYEEIQISLHVQGIESTVYLQPHLRATIWHLKYKNVTIFLKKMSTLDEDKFISLHLKLTSLPKGEFCPLKMKGQKVDEKTDFARPFEGKGEFHLLQMKTPLVLHVHSSNRQIATHHIKSPDSAPVFAPDAM